MKSKWMDRRSVLRGACGVAIALPWLEVMGCSRPDGTRVSVDALGGVRQAVASPVGVTADGFPKRLFTLYMPNGTIPDVWFPTGGESDFKLGVMHAALERHRNSLLIFKGIDNAAGSESSFDSPHFGGMGAMLTGHPSVGETEGSMLANGVSIDQYLGQKIAENAAGAPPFRSLVLGTHPSASGTATISFAGARMPLPKTLTAKQLFAQLFAGTTGADLARVRARRKSMLDGALRDGQALWERLGATDRQRLQAHLDALREVEQRLERATQCQPGNLSPGETDDLTAKLPAMTSEMFDVLALAVSCDLSRVATYVPRTEGATGGLNTYGWLGFGPLGVDSNPDETSKDHHSMSHYDLTPDNRADLIKVSTWYVEQAAALADRLEAIPEGNGTALDHSVILFGSAIGQGNHTLKDIPYFLLGGGAGHFRMGRYLKYESAPNNNLLVSLLNAMGVADTTFGAPKFCTGPLAGLV